MAHSPDILTSQLYSTSEFYIGLGFAISSCLFIGASFIIKKIALIRLSKGGSIRAAAGGFGYLREWIWWTGLITMGIGEAANFAAYAFAPASLVTPLGGLSVLVSSVLASKFLNERLNLLGKLGCFLCILGSTIIVIHAPKEEEIESLEVLIEKLQERDFILYVILVIATTVLIIFYFGPLYGHRNVSVYLVLCSSIGSLTVMSCKGLGLAIRETLSGQHNEMGHWLTWTFLALVIIFITIQMNYLNKSLDMFNTGIVTPVYYVMFTALVLIASAILFKEWKHLSGQDILGSICGFLVVIVAIVLLNTFKDMDISLSDVRGVWRPKRELLHKMNASGDEEGGRRHSYGASENMF